MALIRCPGCNRRVSSRVKTCAHCGTAIAGSTTEHAHAAGQTAGKRARLRIQLLVAVTLFVIGALWLIAANLQPGGANRLLPALLAGAGLIWYAGVRFLLWAGRR